MNIFLDTNIILDYLDTNRQKLFPDSVKIFQLLENGDINLFASALTFSNIAYILRRMNYADLMQTFADLREVIDVLPTDKDVLDTAIGSSFTDFEDAVQYYTAVCGNADVVITRNVDDFIQTSVPVMTPSAYLSSEDR
jgi:predicted nucleic acid-binding protein